MFKDFGPEASNVLILWWILFGVSMLVLALVSIFLFIGAFKKRKASAPLASEESLGRGITYGTAATVLLLIGIIVATFQLGQPLRKEIPLQTAIDVIGKRWWWEVVYYGKNGEKMFTTANQIHIPIGKPIKLRLLSDNVIHSFWVPSLAGKVDLIPGRENFINLKAQEPGIFRGQCAEFCGVQHALMSFHVVATGEDEYEDWIKLQQSGAKEPSEENARRGKRVFKNSRCSECHTIRGVSQATDFENLGPDLTHVASRQWLAAGTLPNRKGHLGGWVSDPQSAKPGNLMPAVKLKPEDFQALLRYLETLK